MASDAERCTEHERILRIDAAFRAGDLTALRVAVENPDAAPNGPLPLEIGPCLEYAIYHSPLPFIRQLLEIGANPNPSIMAVAERNLEAVEVLLQNGADPRFRTTIDDGETPREMAEAAGLTDIARVLTAHEANREGQK